MVLSGLTLVGVLVPVPFKEPFSPLPSADGVGCLEVDGTASGAETEVPGAWSRKFSRFTMYSKDVRTDRDYNCS